MGGGHAHVEVLRRFLHHPPEGVRVTLVARETQSPYSGMLPAYIAGEWSYEALHVDLWRLTQRAGVRLIQAEVCGLDADDRTLHLANRPALRYDALSLNTGAMPAALAPTPGVIPVKPLGQFLPAWQERRAALVAGDRVLVVGLGAGAVELALAVTTQLPAGVALMLVGTTLLPGWPERAKRWARAALRRAGLSFVEGEQLLAYDGQRAHLSDGRSLTAALVLDVSAVRAPEWLGSSGLAVDEHGFIAVNAFLQSLSHATVFAAGDVAALVEQPKPKAGVYAVRAGPLLATNLSCLWRDRPLRRYRPQGTALALLGDSRGRALAVKGPVVLSGRWLVPLKRWIDRRFVQRYNGTLESTAARVRAWQDAEAAASFPAQRLVGIAAAELPDPMRCLGCGGKAPAQVLKAALAGISQPTSPLVLEGIGADAALLRLGEAQVAVTTDTLTAFVSDPYRFAQLATEHALNDLFALGITPDAVLATVSLAAAGERLQTRDLELLLAGVTRTLAQNGAVLVGGHTLTADEPSLGITALGISEKTALEKRELEAGLSLILTKPLGTGVVLAGAMRALCDGREVEAALAAMARSNAEARAVLGRFGVRAQTDVTGFGLLGHLAQLLASGEVGVALDVHAVPLLPGAEVLAAGGVRSSLLPANERLATAFTGAVDHSLFALLCDPQTAGPLLAAVPQSVAQRCLGELQHVGYSDAAVIGVTTKASVGWLLS